MIRYNFHKEMDKFKLDLFPISINTLQVNITKLCNQACQHCHVDASPKRTEQMDRSTVDKCLELLSSHPEITTLDLTGGAPELNPQFDYFVVEAKKLNKHIMVRHNLTVTFDGNPQTKESKLYLPEFFAEHQVEVISSLPYYQEYFTDKQRGKGVFQKSLESLRLLNQQGYGQSNSPLKLNLVYNPVGPFLPNAQADLEKQYKKELESKYGVTFNQLFTITNMPIHRFKDQLIRMEQYDDYMTKLINAFNPMAAEGVMCRTMISIGYDGTIYDCDFNQMLELPIAHSQQPTIHNFNFSDILNRKIIFESHCFGCTAGAGSSCGGETV